MYLGLEGAPESNNKRVLGKSKDVSLIENLLDLLLHYHPMLAHLLHGKPLVGLLVTNQVDSTGGRENIKVQLLSLYASSNYHYDSVTSAHTRMLHC